MYISRFVPLVAKPLLFSLSPRVAPVLCRTITTDQVHVRYGKDSDRYKDKSRNLDVFLGKWVYNPRSPKLKSDSDSDSSDSDSDKEKSRRSSSSSASAWRDLAVHVATKVTDNLRNDAVTRSPRGVSRTPVYSEPRGRTEDPSGCGCDDTSESFLKFSKKNDKWHFEAGTEDFGSTMCYTFVLGKPFTGQFEDEDFYQIRVEQQGGNELKFTFCKVPSGRETFTMRAKAQGDQLKLKTRHADGTKTQKTYFKQ